MTEDMWDLLLKDFEHWAPYFLAPFGALIVSAGLLWVLRPRGRDLLRDTGPWVLAVRILAVFVAGLACLFLFGFVGFLLALVLASAYGNSQNAQLWITLSSALRQNRPLLPVLSAFLQDSKSVAPNARLMRALAAGQSLHEAVPADGKQVLRNSVSLRIAALTGSWSEVLETAHQNNQALREAEELFYGRGLLLTWMCLTAASLASFVSLRIARHLTTIGHEFQVPAQFAAGNFLPGFPISPSDAGPFAAVVVVLAIFLPSLFFAIGGGYLRDCLPFLSSSPGTRWIALQGLAHGVRARKNYPEILEAMAKGIGLKDILFGRIARVGFWYRLNKAQQAILRGTDAADALCRSGLISTNDGEVLKAAETLGNLADAFQTLSDLYRDRHASRLRSWALYGYVLVMAIVAAVAASLYLMILNFLLRLALSLA